MESINVLGRHTAGILLINAMSKNEGYKTILDKFEPVEGVVQVELKINGHVVPIVEALEDAYAHLKAGFEAKVANEARRMLREAGLTQFEAIERALTDARNLLTDRLQAALPDIEFSSEDD